MVSNILIIGKYLKFKKNIENVKGLTALKSYYELNLQKCKTVKFNQF